MMMIILGQNELDIIIHIQNKCFLIFIISICSLVWFIKAPLYRYGYSLLVGFISLIFALISIKSNLNTKRINILCNVLLIIGISAMFSKNIIRIVNNDNNYNNYPWPKYFSHSQNNNDLVKPKKNIVDGWWGNFSL